MRPTHASGMVKGIVLGVVGTWAFHRWVKPMPTTKPGG